MRISDLEVVIVRSGSDEGRGIVDGLGIAFAESCQDLQYASSTNFVCLATTFSSGSFISFNEKRCWKLPKSWIELMNVKMCKGVANNG